MIQDARGKYALFKLQCLDLLVLQEIEYAGINFNTEKARAKAEEIQKELDGINQELSSYVSFDGFNPNSNDHVSALLYGGIIAIDDRIPIGVYKTGAKVGHTRYKVIEKVYELPRLVEPLKGTETAKEGYWKTNADVLRSLKLDKKAKKVVELLNRYSELEKLRGTYLIGWSDLIDKMNWPHNKIHGTLNQTTVVTGRLSSTKPNLQNPDPTTKIFCESLYD